MLFIFCFKLFIYILFLGANKLGIFFDKFYHSFIKIF
jgi:hypothetical protein